MKKLTVGVFGFGDVAVEYVKAINNNMHGQVVAIVGHDVERTKTRVAQLGFDVEVLATFEQRLREIDIDVIVSESSLYMRKRQ